ncbi:MAG: hypothetical protein KGO50_02955, partial [Myxococcales bacterium]|nr:hypothetical protein [Myxococcales bacterium]
AGVRHTAAVHRVEAGVRHTAAVHRVVAIGCRVRLKLIDSLDAWAYRRPEKRSAEGESRGRGGCSCERS